MSIAALGNLVRATMAHPIGRRQPIRSMARIVAWQLRSRMSRRTVAHDWIGGSRLIVENGMTGATGNIYFGLHEFADMAVVLHLLRPGDLMLDIGANVGSYTILAAKVVGARVVAFEPARETLPKLRANIAANGVETMVTVEDCALGDHDGEIAFSVGLDTVNRVGAPGLSEIVKLKRLDAAAAELDPVMLKIDVEGFEPQLFAGAEATLAKPTLRVIETETVDPAIVEQLKRHGFVRRYYDPFTRRLSERAVGIDTNNALFVRDEDWVAQRLATAPRYDVLGISL